MPPRQKQQRTVASRKQSDNRNVAAEYLIYLMCVQSLSGPASDFVRLEDNNFRSQNIHRISIERGWNG